MFEARKLGQLRKMVVKEREPRPVKVVKETSQSRRQELGSWTPCGPPKGATAFKQHYLNYDLRVIFSVWAVVSELRVKSSLIFCYSWRQACKAPFFSGPKAATATECASTGGAERSRTTPSTRAPGAGGSQSPAASILFFLLPPGWRVPASRGYRAASVTM